MRKLVLLSLTALVLASTGDAQARAPRRSVTTVAWAIGVARPSMSKKLRKTYAKKLREVAKRYDFDPFTGVAIIRHESGWRAGAVSRDGEDFGLGQIRARFMKGCRNDIPAAQDGSPSCQAVKARLLNGVYAIDAMGKAIDRHREFCRRYTGRSALFARWLSSYGGYNRMKRGPVCNQIKRRGKWRDKKVPKEVAKIIAYRKKLVRMAKRR